VADQFLFKALIKFSLLLLICTSTDLYSQTTNLDSLQQALKNATGKDRITTLLELCWGYRFVNADTARKYGLSALELAKKGGNEDLEAEALNNIGVTHEAQGNYDEALDFELRALDIRKKLGDDAKTANTLNTLGIIYDEMGNYEKALSHYLDARKVYEGLHDEGKIAMVLINIGIVLRAQKEYHNAIGYYQQAMSIYQKTGNRFGLAACHSNLGAVYLSIPNYDSSLYYSILASREFESQNVRQFLPTPLSNAAIAYDKIGTTDKAKEFFLRAKKLLEEYGNKKELSYTLSQLAKLELKLNNKNGALNYANEALSIAQTIKAMEQIMQAHEALAQINAESADYKNAYKEQSLYIKVKDSLFQSEKSKQLLELQTKYETIKNKQQIESLNHENELKSATIAKNYLIIVGLVLLLSLLIIIFYLWRYRKAQTQKAIAQQQKVRLREIQINSVIESQETERKRFAADLHDGMGQLVSALQLNIQSIKQSNDLARTVSQVESSEQLLSEIQTEIRNIAFNLMPPVLVREGLVPAVRELIRRLNKAGDILVSLAVHEASVRFSPVVEISVYRIIQELLSNITKHSKASEVTVAFTGFENYVVLTIEDNGIWYDIAAFQNSENGNGWRTIQTRINLIQAQIEFDNSEGRKSNTVTIQIPLPIPTTSQVNISENT